LMRRGPVSNSTGFFGMSDAKGQFQMRNIPPGEYRLVVRPSRTSCRSRPTHSRAGGNGQRADFHCRC
jgi:hypothetical protein